MSFFRRLLVLALASCLVVPDNVEAKKTTVKCSCTKSAAGFHKVVTKTAKCKEGASHVAKNKCCAKAASHHSEVCKYHVKPKTKPGLGSWNPADPPSRNCDHPSCAAKANDCSPACNTTAGSVCIWMSGGWSDTWCTCSQVSDCGGNIYDGYGWSCQQLDVTMLPHTYQGKVCVNVECGYCHPP